MIRAVFLDLDNTLLDFQKGAEIGIRETFEQFRTPFLPTVIAVFHRVNDRLWLALERGEIDRPSLFVKRWDEVFREVGVDLPSAAFDEAFRANLHHIAEPVDGAYELLDYLSARYPLYVASNGLQQQQMDRLKKSGMLPYFQAVFTSEELGAEKPGALFFERAFERIGSPDPAETVMIGDSQTADIAGAAAYGMHTVWFDCKRTGASAPKAEVTVSSLDEIQNYW